MLPVMLRLQNKKSLDIFVETICWAFRLVLRRQMPGGDMNIEKSSISKHFRTQHTVKESVEHRWLWSYTRLRRRHFVLMIKIICRWRSSWRIGCRWQFKNSLTFMFSQSFWLRKASLTSYAAVFKGRVIGSSSRLLFGIFFRLLFARELLFLAQYFRGFWR